MTSPGSLTSGFHSHLAAAWFWEVSGAGVSGLRPCWAAGSGSSYISAPVPAGVSSLLLQPSQPASQHSHSCFPCPLRPRDANGFWLGLHRTSTTYPEPPHPWLIPLISVHFWEFLPPRSRVYLPFSPNELYKLFLPIEMGRNDVSGPQEPRSFCARSRGILKPQCWKQLGRKGPIARGPASQLSLAHGRPASWPISWL